MVIMSCLPAGAADTDTDQHLSCRALVAGFLAQLQEPVPSASDPAVVQLHYEVHGSTIWKRKKEGGVVSRKREKDKSELELKETHHLLSALCVFLAYSALRALGAFTGGAIVAFGNT